MICRVVRQSRVLRSLCWQFGLTVWLLGVCLSSWVAAQTPPSATETVRPGMDRYDLRAAEDPGRSERLELVRKSFERQRWDEGAKTLQSLFDDEHDSLVYGNDQIWRTVSESAIALVKASPPAAMTAYLAHVEAVAARDLKQAQATQDRDALIRVARRYPLTPDGQRACRELIDLGIDSGNADAVATLIQQLVRVESPQLADPLWRGQMIDSLKRSDHHSLVSQIEQRFGPTPPRAVADWPWQELKTTRRPPTVNWNSVLGTRDGQALGQLAESIPLVRWRVPLLNNQSFVRVLEEHLRDAQDTSALGLNVLSTVGEGDVVVTRTLSGLTAVRASTGEVLWTSHEWGPEGEFGDELSDIPVLLPIAIERGFIQDLGQRISHRLLFCASLGALSADSRRVYSLTHFPHERDRWELLIQSSFAESDEDTPPESTYLFARDLQTGQVVWRAGGPASEEFPGLPCDGAFLFGPPTPDGEELFVVGERAGDILLFCLEAQTGLVRWEQLLASAGRGIELDTVRKCWTAPVSVRGSLVICPTTTGWVTAIDRITRKIVWSTRLQSHDPSEEVSESSFDARNRESAIDERWAPAQPMLVGDRVLVTAMEFPDEHSRHSAQLHCLNAATGQKVWEIPKGAMLGLIGSWQDRMLAFEARSICAWNLADGKQLWNVSLDQRLAGRPVLTDQGIVVPLISGELQVLDPVNGKFLESSLAGHAELLPNEATPHVRQLGNLMTTGGRLFSTSPQELLSFEWKSEIARWEAESRTNLSAAIRHAQSIALAGQADDAARLLRESVPLAGKDAKQLEQLRVARFSVLIRALSQLLQEKTPVMAGEQLQELHSLVQTPGERSSVSRLEIEFATQTGNWQAAWSALREMINLPAGPSVDFTDRTVHSDQWIADRILELGRLPDATARAAARMAIQDEFSRLWTASHENQRSRLARQFAATGLIDQAIWNLVDTGESARNLAHWQMLADSSESRIANAAKLRIIETLAVPDWIGEARRRFAELPPADQWPDDLRRKYEATRQKLDGVIDADAEPGPSWLGRKIDIQRIGDFSGESYSGARLLLHWIGEPCPGLARFEFLYDERFRSIRILRRDGSQYWEMRLATNDQNPIDEEAPIVHASGLNLYVLHMGVLHAFSPVERQLVWRHYTTLDELDSIGGVWRSVMRRSRLHSVNQWRQELLQNSEEENRKLEVATSSVVVLRVDQSIQVLDARDGTVQWTLASSHTVPMRADRDRLYALSPNEPWCRSIRSGRVIDAPDLHRPEAPLVVTDSPQLLNLTEQPGDGRNWRVEGVRFAGVSIPGASGTAPWDQSDVATIETAWSVAVPSNGHLGRGPAGSIVSLLPSGEVRLIDWKTGRIKLLGTATLPQKVTETEPSPRFYGGADLERYYLTCDVGEEHGELDIPALPAFGRVAAFPLLDPSLPTWQLETQGFLLSRATRNAPFLPILNLKAQTLADRNYQRVHLQLLDKATGKLVYELKNSPSWGLGASSCDYDTRRQWWTLNLAAERIRLSPAFDQ